MKRVYIAGGITGVEDYKKRFDEAEQMLRAKGFIVYNPTTFIVDESLGYMQIMQICLKWLSFANAIYMLEGWEQSRGAKMEYEKAKELKLDIMYKKRKFIEAERTNRIETEDYKIGDVISFELLDGEPIKAMAVRQEENGMLFIFVDCIKEEKSMVDDEDDEESSYKDTDMRTYLNADLLERFPEEIREKMQPMEHGDYLRLATEKEIFGVNKYGDDEGDSVQQFEPMKLRRNRIAFAGDSDGYQWWWLQTKSKDYASNFSLVSDHGHTYCNHVRVSNGVRPVFLLSTIKE